MEQETKPKAPYMSFQTFWNFISDLSTKPLPPQLDTSLMKSKSGSDKSNLTSALKEFRLIREDLTVERLLEDFVTPDETQRKKVLAQIVETFYPVPLQLSASIGTEKQLLETFRDAYGIEAADTRRKAVTFFLHAARTAGLELSPHFPSTRTGTGAPRPAKRTPTKRKPTAGQGDDTEDQSRSPVGDVHRLTLNSGGTVVLAVDVNLFKLDTEDREFIMKLVDSVKEYPSLKADLAPSEGGDA